MNDRELDIQKLHDERQAHDLTIRTAAFQEGVKVGRGDVAEKYAQKSFTTKKLSYVKPPLPGRPKEFRWHSITSVERIRLRFCLLKKWNQWSVSCIEKGNLMKDLSWPHTKNPNPTPAQRAERVLNLAYGKNMWTEHARQAIESELASTSKGTRPLPVRRAAGGG